MSGYGLDLLAFAAHPDDAELFCGGLLATMADRGYRTGIVDLTRGEKSTRGTVEMRSRESEAASQALGLHVRENLGLPDGGLDPLNQDAMLAIVEVLRRHRPELVAAPWERERHPDHEAASTLLTRALFFAAVQKVSPGGLPAFNPRQVLYYPMRTTAHPSVIVDVTASYGKKMAALRCYVSQVGPSASAAPTLVGSPLSLTSLEARDAFHGAQIGVERGEPYVTREAVGLVDPLEHYRKNAFAPALFFPSPQ